jgi:hypothetical protein
MDIKVSRKETRYQPQGLVEVLMSSITDFYPVFDPLDEDVIADVGMLDDERTELLDRGMWAVMKQRGNDPLDAMDGNQIEECILGEVSPVVLMSQIIASVLDAGPGVKADFTSTQSNGKEYLTVSIMLTNTV